MLRRYMISNAVSTVALYAAIWAYVPSPSSVSQAISSTIDTYIMGHTFLGPVLHRMITVGADIASWF